MSSLLRTAALFACACLILSASASSHSSVSRGTPLIVGVSDDAPMFPADGGWAIYGDEQSLGMSEDRESVLWNPDQPTTIQNQGFLDRSVPVAGLRKINLVLDIYPSKATGLSSSSSAPQQFCAYVGQVAQRYRSVKTFIILNEPNQPRFMQPQFDSSGNNVSAPLAEQTLALCHDTLKGIDPSITVVGLGISPRGNDQPHAPNNVSTSPVRFMKYFGDAYRASGRTTPLMDQMGVHLYPNDPSRDTPDTVVQWPNVSLASLDRLQLAVADAFCGTAQPVFAGSNCSTTAAFRSTSSARAVATPETLKWKLDEIGWQTQVLDTYAHLYTGTENITPTSEEAQAQYYVRILNFSLCDSLISELLYFHLIDETDLGNGFQSGIERPDLSHKPAYDPLKSAIADGLADCQGTLHTWVDQGKIVANWSADSQLAAQKDSFPYVRYWAIRLPAGGTQEDAAAGAAIIKVGDKTFNPLDPTQRQALQNAVDQKLGTIHGTSSAGAAGAPQVALFAKANVKAYFNPLIKLPSRTLKPGFYVEALVLSPWANPNRETLLTSNVFAVSKVKPKKH